jgi:hypothetical protein
MCCVFLCQCKDFRKKDRMGSGEEEDEDCNEKDDDDN